ncbi:MAG TPA: response regulator transcription factor, partial [Deltaproteobacteria bacterium]|nr:response regulator transcription factor [Deltaproteobacteria bacterium]
MIRVVIADDHAVARLGLRALLSSAPDIGLVGEGASGEEALRLCADHQPDVLVIDLSMRGLDGLDAIRELSRRPSPPRILTLTMHEEEDYLIPSLEAGANGYIMKSAASATLLEAIRAVARG